MKILYSAAGTPIPGTHGGSVHAFELCRALARGGHEVHIAALPAEGSATVGEDDGVILHPLRRRPTLLEWTAVGALGALVRELRPDVVVERFYTFGGAAIGAAHAAGVPAVLEVNSPAREYPGSLRDRLDRMTIVRPIDRWRRKQLARCAAIYTTSRHLVPEELQAEVTVVVNGVDVQRFRPAVDRSPGGPLRCVYVSSFRAWHGAEDLVAAIARCDARRIPVHLTCVGRGPRWNAARELAVAEGVDHLIEFVGRVSHRRVPELLAAADVGLAPFAPAEFSALELGWFWSPIKIFEYLAAGLAVVTADIPELRELLPGGVATFYSPGDPIALAEVLGELERDRAAVGTMGEAARALAEREYTWDRQAEVVEGVLRSVVQ